MTLQEKLSKGWVHARMFFEVMAVTEELTEQSLKDHIAKVKKMNNVFVASEVYGEMEKVEHPPRKIKEAWSQIAEVEVAVSSLENLLYAVVFFGPSSVEIIAPKKFTVDFGEAQAMMNTVAELMHKYASSGAGGIVISTKK